MVRQGLLRDLRGDQDWGVSIMNRSERIDLMLHEVREGRLSWASFQASTRREWVALGRWLHQRWHVPAGVTADDVTQELLFAAWRHIPRWRPDAGPTLRGYVVYRAIRRAQRFINCQRNSERRSCNSLSRFPVPSSSLSREEVRELPVPVVQPEQEEIVHREQVLVRLLAECPSRRRQFCLSVLLECGGSVERAAVVLMSDDDMRMLCGLRSLRGARRAIYETLERVAGVSVAGSRSQ